MSIRNLVWLVVENGDEGIVDFLGVYTTEAGANDCVDEFTSRVPEKPAPHSSTVLTQRPHRSSTWYEAVPVLVFDEGELPVR